MLAFDLGSTKWTLGFTTAPAQRPRIRTMPAGDLGTLVKEIQLAKARFGLPLGAPVRSCDEAGRDGFWLHRWLLAHSGVFVRMDRLWYSSVHYQEVAARLVNFPVEPYVINLTNYSGKATFRVSPRHTLVFYGQRGLNHQPNRLDPYCPKNRADELA